MHLILRLSVVGLLVLASLPAAEESWTKLKIGMSAEKALSILGFPLLRSKGHGFETWTYDNGAEVLLHATVVGWTAPTVAKSPMRSNDVWRGNHPGKHYATMQAALVEAVPIVDPLPLNRRKRGKGSAGVGFEEYFQG